MPSLPNIKLQTRSGREIEIAIAPPHQFVLDRQQQLLPDWKVEPAYMILLLQQSSISLKVISPEADREKNLLRAKFIYWGRALIFALQDRGYQGELFDPRTGCPLFGRQGINLDDNAVAKALLNYPVVSYRQCSLLIHPTWGDRVYPSTMVTSAPQEIIKLTIKQISATQKWTTKVSS
ncbi:methylmalonic aciduria and homocystinuria type D protein [Pleurocapsales cyanobacterium LEGE 10410]|nr:methylmalonic aciduria and homocystinuria type D protein [Pleurocapsales cyanobacterium LEGE 10410]